MHKKLQLIYGSDNIPYGIRDESGFLFFFSGIRKYQGQEERYRKEKEERKALAKYLLNALKNRA